MGKKIGRKFFQPEDIPALCAGLFCAGIGTTALCMGQQMRSRMMLLLSLGLLLWGIACTRNAMKENEPVSSILRGLYFVLFGAVMLLANLGGVAYSSRVLGTMLFLYGAAPIALLFAEKTFDQQKLVYGFLYASLGCILVLFSGEKGILPAVCVTLCGILIVRTAFHPSYNFCCVGDAKDVGGENL